MAHTRTQKSKLKTMFNKWRTFEIKTKLGNFEIDEYRDFHIVKKKLTHPKQRGFYDPTALVIAKRDRFLPFFPERDWSFVFGTTTPFFPINIGVTGKKDDFIKTMKKAVKDKKLTMSEVWSIPVSFRETTGYLKPKIKPIDLGSSKFASWIEKKIYGHRVNK